MIIISLSQDLEDNPNLVIIDCIKSFGHFFFVSQLGKCQHRSKPLIICPKPSNLWGTQSVGKIPQRRSVLRAPNHMFEGGNFVKSKSDTCDQYPLKTLQPHKLCDSATEPSLPMSVRFIYYFVFEEIVQFAFAYYNLHFVCAQEKADL